jgi:hypothetical protein
MTSPRDDYLFKAQVEYSYFKVNEFKYDCQRQTTQLGNAGGLNIKKLFDVRVHISLAHRGRILK